MSDLLDVNNDGFVDVNDFLTLFSVFLSDVAENGKVDYTTASNAVLRTISKMFEHDLK